MRFRKEDLLETRDMLDDGLGLGGAEVYFSEKKGLYTAGDFELVRGFEKEILGEKYLSGRASLDAWDFYDTLRHIAQRPDLGLLVDVEKMQAVMEKEFLQVLIDIKKMGLAEPFLEQQIRNILKYGDGPESPVMRDFGSGPVGFLPDIHYYGGLDLKGFAVMVPKGELVHELVYFPKEVSIERVAEKVNDVQELRIWSQKVYEDIEFKNTNMNRNSLENFRNEAKALKVPQHMVSAAEALMEKGVEKFEVHGQLAADKGLMDLTVHMKKSGQSDYYYLNRFEVAQSKAKPLEKDHQYAVFFPDPKGEHDQAFKRFDSAVQAMDYFRDQKGNAELALGKYDKNNLVYKDTLATMKEGKVDYVNKEFQIPYYSPILRNSHYVDRGKGFTVEQAANMLQGRAVFREDMVSRAGEQYKAWSQYQFDQPKDRYGNYTMKQYGEGYGFDLKKELSGFEIKEIGTKEGLEKLVTDMQNGNRPLVNVVLPEGGERKLFVEAVPRYTNLNFFEMGGKPVKREELKKESAVDLGQGQEKGKARGKDKAKENELSL